MRRKTWTAVLLALSLALSVLPASALAAGVVVDGEAEEVTVPGGEKETVPSGEVETVQPGEEGYVETIPDPDKEEDGEGEGALPGGASTAPTATSVAVVDGRLFYDSLNAALTYTGSGTVVLRADVSEDVQVHGSVTLDLAGYTITTQSIFVTGSLTIEDSAGTGLVDGPISTGSGGRVSIRGGRYTDSITAYVSGDYVATTRDDYWEVYRAFDYTFGPIQPEGDTTLIVVWGPDGEIVSNAYPNAAGQRVATFLNVAKEYTYEVTAPGYETATGTITAADRQGDPITLVPIAAEFSYEIDGTTLILSGDGAVYDYESAPYTPWSGAGITDVVVEPGITRIGDRSLAIRTLERASLSSTVTSIGQVALGFTALTELEIPASVTSIEAAAFDSSSGLTITFLGGAPDLAKDVFSRCTGLTVRYPAGAAGWADAAGQDYGSADTVTWEPYGEAAQEEAELSLVPSHTKLTGGGTVTLTISGIPEGQEASLTGTGLAQAETVRNGTYSVELPDRTLTYTFRLTYAGDSQHEEAEVTCTIRVTASGEAEEETETVENEDGSTTATVTDEAAGTVTETTTYPDGTIREVVTQDDGTVTTTVTEASGVITETVQSPGEKGTSLSVTVPSGEAAVVVVDGIAEVTDTTVAMDPETGEIVKVSVPVEGGLAIRVEGSQDLVLVDNRKEFSDTTGHWATGAVDFVTSREIFSGTGEGTFSPDAPMTRAMLMTVLARFDGQDTEGGSVWYERGMDWAKENGISDGTDPDGDITREQLATMLYRYAGTPEPTGDLGAFPDAGQVGSYAVDAMRWAVESGLISGTGDGSLSPLGAASRAEVATILMRFCQGLVR